MGFDVETPLWAGSPVPKSIAVAVIIEFHLPGPSNYPLLDSKYHQIRTIRFQLRVVGRSRYSHPFEDSGSNIREEPDYEHQLSSKNQGPLV